MMTAAMRRVTITLPSLRSVLSGLLLVVTVLGAFNTLVTTAVNKEVAAPSADDKET